MYLILDWFVDLLNIGYVVRIMITYLNVTSETNCHFVSLYSNIGAA